MKYCSRCGAALPDDARFCGSCGQPAEKPESTGPEGPQPPEKPTVTDEAARPEEQPKFYSEGVPEPEAFPPNDGQPSLPPQKKKRIWLWILLGVLAAAAAAACILFFSLRRTPVGRLAAAIVSTVEQSEDLQKNAESLKKYQEFLQKIHNSARITLEYSDSSEGAGSLEFRVAADPEQGKSRMDMSLNIDIMGSYLPMTFQMYEDEDEIQLALPELLEDVLSIEPDETVPGTQWLDTADAMQYLSDKDLLKKLKEGLTIRKTGTEMRLVAGERKKCDIYEIEMDRETAKVLKGLFFGTRQQFLEDADLEVESCSLVVEGGHLRGILCKMTIDGEQADMEFLLDGKENPLTSIRVAVRERDSEEELTSAEIRTEPVETGLEITFLAEDEEVLKISYHDDEETFCLRAGEEEIRFRLSMEEDTLSMKMEASDAEMTLGISPDAGIQPEKLSEHPLRISKMTPMEQQRLAAEIFAALARNPAIRGILESMIQ